MRMRHLSKCILSGLCLGIWLCVRMLAPAYAYESSTLYNGCRGDDVRELQQALIDLGFLKGTADGIFGNKTENAVRAFQKTKGNQCLLQFPHFFTAAAVVKGTFFIGKSGSQNLST